MMIFWLAASVMIAIGLVLILPCLLKPAGAAPSSRDAVNLSIFRDRLTALDEEHASGALDKSAFVAARNAIEQQMLAELDTPPEANVSSRPGPILAVALAMTLPLMALGMYFQFGTPQILAAATASTARTDVSDNAAAGAGALPHSLEEMVSGLEQRLRSKPNNPDGWLMLGRSYAAVNRLPQARDALAEADRQRPSHPVTLVAYAEVLAGLNGNRIKGRPLELIHQALATDPQFARGLWLAGMGAYRSSDARQAITFWQRLSQVKGLDAKSLAQVHDALAQAKQKIEGQAGASPPAATSAGTSPERSTGNSAQILPARLKVRVSVDPRFKERAIANQLVFVFARAARGPRMPLAVQRLSVADLPRTVILDDSMAMTPELRLSAFKEVVVSARISSTGSATPKSGDLVGTSPPMSPKASSLIEIMIDQMAP